MNSEGFFARGIKKIAPWSIAGIGLFGGIRSVEADSTLDPSLDTMNRVDPIPLIATHPIRENNFLTLVEDSYFQTESNPVTVLSPAEVAILRSVQTNPPISPDTKEFALGFPLANGIEDLGLFTEGSSLYNLLHEHIITDFPDVNSMADFIQYIKDHPASTISEDTNQLSHLQLLVLVKETDEGQTLSSLVLQVNENAILEISVQESSTQSNDITFEGSTILIVKENIQVIDPNGLGRPLATILDEQDVTFLELFGIQADEGDLAAGLIGPEGQWIGFYQGNRLIQLDYTDASEQLPLNNNVIVRDINNPNTRLGSYNNGTDRWVPLRNPFYTFDPALAASVRWENGMWVVRRENVSTSDGMVSGDFFVMVPSHNNNGQLEVDYEQLGVIYSGLLGNNQSDQLVYVPTVMPIGITRVPPAPEESDSGMTDDGGENLTDVLGGIDPNRWSIDPTDIGGDTFRLNSQNPDYFPPDIAERVTRSGDEQYADQRQQLWHDMLINHPEFRQSVMIDEGNGYHSVGVLARLVYSVDIPVINTSYSFNNYFFEIPVEDGFIYYSIGVSTQESDTAQNYPHFASNIEFIDNLITTVKSNGDFYEFINNAGIRSNVTGAQSRGILDSHMEGFVWLALPTRWPGIQATYEGRMPNQTNEFGVEGFIFTLDS